MSATYEQPELLPDGEPVLVNRNNRYHKRWEEKRFIELLTLWEQKVAEAEKNAVKGLPLHVAVMHADALDEATALRNRVLAHFDCSEIFITEFTPVMGVHTGPGLIGVAFYSGD